MQLTIEYERETDGRWIAEVVNLPGVMAYGTTKEEARRHAQALALITLADQLENGALANVTDVHFTEAA